MRVLTQALSNGQIRYCDAKCHNARSGPCNCICEGLLHGHGSEYAKLNARRTAEFLAYTIKSNTTDIEDYLLSLC